MRLTADASALVSELLRVRGRRLLAGPRLELVMATEAYDEAEHELRKRVALLVERRQQDPATASQLFDEILTIIVTRIAKVEHGVYAAALEEAHRRIPRAPRDAPTVALALTLDCGIWTADYDFFGCGVPVWVTETLQAHLDAHDSR